MRSNPVCSCVGEGVNRADYLMVLPVRHYRMDHDRVAVEGAFAEHLRLMRGTLGARVCRLVVASPAMTADTYNVQAPTMLIVDGATEGISFCTLYTDSTTGSWADKALRFASVLRRTYRATQSSSFIHSGLSWNAMLPFEFASIVLGVILRKRTVFVVDIDYRESARMSYRAGTLSRKSYLICRHVYDRIRNLQVRFAGTFCSLVLLKGRKMVADFGRGRPNVQYFLDAAHSEANIIGAGSLERKFDLLTNRELPLRVVYFGRLTAYKGVALCIESVALARTSGANVQLDIIGDGPDLPNLQRVIKECHAGTFVKFLGARPFNQQFFELLYEYQLILAAPLREDTPRSALDAMAAGVAYLAFDTYYYRELLESGAGQTVAWLDVPAMAAALVDLDGNRQRVVEMVESAVAYAKANTQDVWLQRRLSWTLPSSGTPTLPHAVGYRS